MAGIIFDPLAKAKFVHHLKVKARALLYALCLHQFTAALECFDAQPQLLLDRFYGTQCGTTVRLDGLIRLFCSKNLNCLVCPPAREPCEATTRHIEPTTHDAPGMCISKGKSGSSALHHSLRVSHANDTDRSQPALAEISTHGMLDWSVSISRRYVVTGRHKSSTFI